MTQNDSAVTKSALCYMCALRMSIMHQLPPPSPPSMIWRLHQSEHIDFKRMPLVDDEYHPHFSIVYETSQSAHRFFDATVSIESTPLASSDAGYGAFEFLGGRSLSHLCIACLGLYQFLDHIYAPRVAAAIRNSSYIDSDVLSANVNVHRSMSFLWLAVAALFYGVAGREAERPKSAAIIPEEHSNFKEFFMSDLRARVLQYTNCTHAELCKRATAEGNSNNGTSIKMTLPLGCETYFASTASSRVVQAFAYSPESAGVIVEVSAEQREVRDLAGGKIVPSQYCTNRCDGVLTYSVVYDHVMPYLTQLGWIHSTSPGVLQAKGQPLETIAFTTTVQHANIMLMGTYRKMRRDLSQSPWFANGARVGSFSLQEIIANPILPFFFPEGVTSLPARFGNQATQDPSVAPPSVKRQRREEGNDPGANPHQLASQHVFGYGRYKFHSAGREDVDVRMLGNGRPFVLELVSPSRQRVSTEDLAAFVTAVNQSEGGSVEVDDLRLTDAEVTVRLARHSESKVKTYRCVVWCSRAIPDAARDEHFQATNQVRDLVITQRTPLRVLHRRSLQARPRTIHSIKLTPLNAHWFLVDLETQAGTYVKEFVHGDMGRTTPHLGALLQGRTDIIQLDVLGMLMEGL